MDIKVLRNSEDIFILKPGGSLDLYSSYRIKETVMKLIDKKVEGIIIDLGDVDKICSEGIGALVNISSTLKKMSILLAMTNMNEPVLKTMKVTKLASYLPIASDLREALEMIKPA